MAMPAYLTSPQDFYMSVLGSSATKRDARSYLSRFTPAKAPEKSKPASSADGGKPILYKNGVNLGSFYGNARAVAESPKFVQHPQKQIYRAAVPQLHVALVKIRAPQTLTDDTLYGIGRTLSQLGRLGLTSIVVVDCNSGLQLNPDSVSRRLALEQTDRVAAAIDAGGEPRARVVNNVIGISEMSTDSPASVYVQSKVHVTLRQLLMTPLRRGIILVIPPIGYTDRSQISYSIPADDIILALTRELAGFQSLPFSEDNPDSIAESLRQLQNEISLDKLIILDPLGGIPAADRPNGYHVFLNMEQEYHTVKQDILRAKALNSDKSTDEVEVRKLQHIHNLQLARSMLSMLPPTSSALLTTPDEAANSGRGRDSPFQATGVGTRRQKNPLIHNLLTDKPVFSSSLPVGRLGHSSSLMMYEPAPSSAYIDPTTFAKHGMSVSIFPDPKIAPWEPPIPGKPRLHLTDSYIDLPRLVHLIQDSFNRKLDVPDYLRRVNGRIAGVIIAGEYEGGALLTWETPPGVVDDGSAESRARMVPYLDKFAVLKCSQGGSVADVVFNAMVRDCFPSGVCWRSRRRNPVNKWYFERSRGTWKLPGTDWTMFWTTPDLSMDQQTFRDYEGVCRGVVPSWDDS
jgi:amino-acid N-acetyltransferase